MRFGRLACGYGLNEMRNSVAEGKASRSASVEMTFCLNTPQRSEAKRRWLKGAVRLAATVRFGRLACGYGLNENAQLLRSSPLTPPLPFEYKKGEGEKKDGHAPLTDQAIIYTEVQVISAVFAFEFVAS